MQLRLQSNNIDFHYRRFFTYIVCCFIYLPKNMRNSYLIFLNFTSVEKI